MNQSIGLIVIDSIAMFYRLELGSTQDYSEVNSSLAKQLVSLLKISREHDIPTILTDQVYADFENKNEVKMVGGDIIKYISKCIIELKKFNSLRKAIIKRHRALPEGRMVDFIITQGGIISKEVN